ncbi:MAG: hypothetical protein NVV63_12470 [Opitutus sp.]|nr:hypothetical protein [Opitutus sp.]
MLSLEARLQRFTPITCRILARRVRAKGGVVALTDEEIAAGSGLSVPEVAKLSRLRTWTGVPVDTMLAFTKGCGINLSSRDSMKTHSAIIRRSSDVPRYLRTAPHWEEQLDRCSSCP